MFRSFGHDIFYSSLNTPLRGGGGNVPQQMEKILSLEPMVRFTSNQSVNLSLNIIKNSILKLKNWTMKGHWRALTQQGPLNQLLQYSTRAITVVKWPMGSEGVHSQPVGCSEQCSLKTLFHSGILNPLTQIILLFFYFFSTKGGGSDASWKIPLFSFS